MSGVVSEKASLCPRSRGFLQCYLLGVSLFAFYMYVSHPFWVYFYVGCKVFVFLWIWMFNSSNTICWRACLCSVSLPLLLCQRSVGSMCVALFLGSACCCIDLFAYSVAQPHSLDSCSFTHKSWSQVASVLQLCSSLSKWCWLFWVFTLSI